MTSGTTRRRPPPHFTNDRLNMRSVATWWAVYWQPVKRCADGMRFICEQSEWETMKVEKPGVYTLIQENIDNEGEAERLARGASGATRPRNSRQSKWQESVKAQ